jgi:MFS transporter, ACS family, hexuronate transporter
VVSPPPQEVRRTAEAAPESGSSGGLAAWGVAITATLGMSVSYVDRQTLAAIAPSVSRALSIDNAHYGLLLSAFSMSYLVGAPLAGIVVDRLGARRGFTIAVVVWSVVAGAHAFAASFGILFLLRILLGAAEAPSHPAAAQAIRRALPGAKRALAFGMLFTGGGFGAMVAAKLAVPLEAAYGFRGAFLGAALVGTLWLPLWLIVTRGRGLGPPSSLASATTTSLPLRESWWTVVTSPPVLRAIVAIIGSAPSLMFVLNWTSKYLVEGWGMPKGAIANYLIVAPLSFDLGAVGFGWLASTRVDPTPARTGTGMGTRTRTHVDLFVVAMILCAALALAPLVTTPTGAIALCAASAVGGGGIYSLVTNDMLSRVPVERTSAASGMTAAAQSLAHIVAGPLVGWTIDRTHGYGVALVGLGVIVVPTTLLFIFWPGLSPSGARTV